MAEIENIHCPICTQPIPSSWQNGLPPALATNERRGARLLHLLWNCCNFLFPMICSNFDVSRSFREKKLSMVNFLIFVQKNVSTIRFQEIKIRPFGDFEKMRFLCFYIIKSMARKGYFGPKSDFRGSKIPPRGASST